MNKPKYNTGQILDIRPNVLPDRIMISTIYAKRMSKEWMYCVLSEQANGYIYMSESMISEYESKHEQKCYENNSVKELYRCGFRFYRNSNKKYAETLAKSLKTYNEISNIIITSPAIYPNGDKADDKCGIWVRYKTIISLENDEKTGDIQINVIK